MKNILKAIWQFCSYLFWPQWGPRRGVREEAGEWQMKAG